METRIILLVEDSDDDVFLFSRAASRAGGALPFRRAKNGQAAIDYLMGVGAFADRDQFPLPHLILVDLKMPVCDGFDFLAWKKTHNFFTYIPAVVLTSSAEEKDVRRCYDLGAQSFTTKVADSGVFARRLSALRDWWFNHCNFAAHATA